LFEIVKNQARIETAGRGLVDPSLLRRIHNEYHHADSTRKAQLETDFSLALHDVRMSGVWKRTNPNRLKETEKALISGITEQQFNDVKILDVGASDGITTLELVEAVRSTTKLNVSGVVADLNIVIEEFRFGPLREYRTVSGETVCSVLGPFGLRLDKRTPEATIGPVERLYLSLGMLRRKLKSSGAIPLTSPKVAIDTRLSVSAFNCLELRPNMIGSFNVIRASNVINLDYFSPENLKQAVRNCEQYLRPGGLLVISRNVGSVSNEVEHGSMWKKGVDGTLTRVLNFGNGSEIASIADTCRH
jgi:SAM-dependent methyltransferase